MVVGMKFIDKFAVGNEKRHNNDNRRANSY